MTHTKDEALKLAIQSLESCSGVPHWPAICATIVTIKQALAQPAPVEPDWKAEYLKSVESGCITLDELRETLAELEATNRQVEILSDALAESRREVAALKAVQEPWGYGRVSWGEKMFLPTLPSVRDGGWMALYTTPPAQRQWVGLTDIEKLSVCRVGPVYAPDGVVTRTPIQYRKELEGVALMAVRQAEAKLKEKNT
jgi:hypothetical protein